MKINWQLLKNTYSLLTIKPVMYVCNVDEGSVVDGNDFVNKVKDGSKDENAEVLIISAIEADIISLDH